MSGLIHSYIDPAGMYLNGTLTHATLEDENYLKSQYQFLGADYPKFYKMDRLSKMAFLCVEIMQAQIAAITTEPTLLFANSSASEETDQRFIHSYETLGNPSPSLFVYTLPNIVTGELSIRHKWYGENAFFILPHFDAAFFAEQCALIFSRGNDAVLGAWVETNSNGKEECFVFLTTKSAFESQDIAAFKTLLTHTYNQYTHE